MNHLRELVWPVGDRCDDGVLFAKYNTALHVRSAALLEVAEAAAAADFEMAVRRERGRENRRADMRLIAEALAAKSDVEIDYATDMLYTAAADAAGSEAAQTRFAGFALWKPMPTTA